MIEPNAQVKTGMFLTIGAALLAFSILVFGGAKTLFTPYNKYYVNLNSAQGLEPGSVVSLSGKKIGNVEKVKFNENAKLVAEVRIESRYQDLITKSAMASLRTQGALGDKYIYITPGLVTDPVIAENGTINTNSQPDLIDLITEKATDMSIVLDTVTEFHRLLQNLNANNNSAMLFENIVDASKSLSTLMNEPDIRGSFHHLNSILRKVDKGDGTLGQLVNNDSLHLRLMGILGEPPRNKFLKPLLRDAIEQSEKK